MVLCKKKEQRGCSVFVEFLTSSVRCRALRADVKSNYSRRLPRRGGLSYESLFIMFAYWLFLRAAVFLCRIPFATAWSVFLTTAL